MANPFPVFSKNLQIRDLPLTDSREQVAVYERRLAAELRRKGLKFTPHLWIADDWFCPDGVPGFAVPFYLFHPKLIAMEKAHIGVVEGVTERRRMRLMRHELGHAVDNAYGLRKNKQRQAMFGDSSKPYPRRYWPQKHSTRFVSYLGDAYAQSHPDEDFAETFAVWLDPQSQWRQRDKTTQAYKKLLFMDSLMKSLRGQAPILKNKFTVDSASKDTRTLAEYYKNKRLRFQLHHFVRVDQNIASMVRGESSLAKRIFVWNYLDHHRAKLIDQVAKSTGEYKYLINRVINITIKRAESQGSVATQGVLMKVSGRLIQKNLMTLKKRRLLDYYL
jgi:hypothetical protein